MTKPKMILFDQGGTLTHQSNWNPEKGNRELMKYVVKNPHNHTVEDVIKRASEIYNGEIDSIKKQGYDFCMLNLNKTLFESLGIELSLSPLEAETVFWDASCDCEKTEGIDILLKNLDTMGIRTAVVSNLSGNRITLKRHIEKYLPENKFEFFIASSEYVFRKPSRFLYEVAINKSGLSPDEIWYCGDNIEADVIGAHNAGMFSVWYDNEKQKEERINNTALPDFEFLHIRKWSELTDYLNKSCK